MPVKPKSPKMGVSPKNGGLGNRGTLGQRLQNGLGTGTLGKIKAYSKSGSLGTGDLGKKPKLVSRPYDLENFDNLGALPVGYDYSKGKKGRSVAKQVESSNIASLRYDDANQLMYVTFNSGAEYVYQAVPRSVYEDILNAPSKGSKFWDDVRVRGTVYGTQYSYRKL